MKPKTVGDLFLNVLQWLRKPVFGVLVSIIILISSQDVLALKPEEYGLPNSQTNLSSFTDSTNCQALSPGSSVSKSGDKTQGFLVGSVKDTASLGACFFPNEGFAKKSDPKTEYIYFKVGDSCKFGSDRGVGLNNYIGTELVPVSVDGVSKEYKYGQFRKDTFGELISKKFFCDTGEDRNEATAKINTIDDECGGKPFSTTASKADGSVYDAVCLFGSTKRADKSDKITADCANNIFGSASCEFSKFLADIGNFLFKVVVFLIVSLLILVKLMFQVVIYVMGYLLNILVWFNPASNAYIGVTQTIFPTIVNIVSLIVIIYMVYTALQFIFNEKSPDFSAFILKLAVIGIGVPFSYTVAAVLINLGYLIGYVFLAALSNSPNDIFGTYITNVANILSWTGYTGASADIKGPGVSNLIPGSEVNVFEQLNKLWTTSFNTWGIQGFNASLQQLLGSLIAIYFMYLGIQVMFRLLKFFTIRIATLFMLLILSPIIYVMYIADEKSLFKKYGQDGMDLLIKNVIVFPIAAIGLSLGLSIVTQVWLALQTLNYK
jgi:hypothetical protein